MNTVFGPLFSTEVNTKQILGKSLVLSLDMKVQKERVAV